MNYHNNIYEFMNFEDLKELIEHIKAKVPCSNCDYHYIDEDISVIVTLPLEGIFSLNCNKCGATTLANVGIATETTHRTIVTKKDVSEMHEFLENFNGDFKSLFKSHKK